MAKDELAKAERRWANRSLFHKRRRRAWRVVGWLAVLGVGLAALFVLVQDPHLLPTSLFGLHPQAGEHVSSVMTR